MSTNLDKAIPPGNPESAKCRWCERTKRPEVSAGTAYLICVPCDLTAARTVPPK